MKHKHICTCIDTQQRTYLYMHIKHESHLGNYLFNSVYLFIFSYISETCIVALKNTRKY